MAKPGLSIQARKAIIAEKLEEAESNLIKSEIALAMSEEIEPLLLESDESHLEEHKKDYEGWTKIVARLKKDYYGGEGKSP